SIRTQTRITRAGAANSQRESRIWWRTADRGRNDDRRARWIVVRCDSACGRDCAGWKNRVGAGRRRLGEDAVERTAVDPPYHIRRHEPYEAREREPYEARCARAPYDRTLM